MADFPDAIRNQIVDWLNGKADPLPVAGTRYVALFDGDPQGAGVEVTTTVRAGGRVAMTAAMEAAGTTNPGEAVNTTEIDFGNAAAGSTGTQITHMAIYDSQVGGTLLASDALAGGVQTVTEGNPIKVPAGSLSVSIA